jgi:hypothetical protein
MKDDRLTSHRRTLQQIVHCAQEALSAHEHDEDPRHVVDDLTHAKGLIDHALKTFLPMARGASSNGRYVP